jgi:hypothetical protein
MKKENRKRKNPSTSSSKDRDSTPSTSAYKKPYVTVKEYFQSQAYLKVKEESLRSALHQCKFHGLHCSTTAIDVWLMVLRPLNDVNTAEELLPICKDCKMELSTCLKCKQGKVGLLEVKSNIRLCNHCHYSIPSNEKERYRFIFDGGSTITNNSGDQVKVNNNMKKQYYIPPSLNSAPYVSLSGPFSSTTAVDGVVSINSVHGSSDGDNHHKVNDNDNRKEKTKIDPCINNSSCTNENERKKNREPGFNYRPDEKFVRRPEDFKYKGYSGPNGYLKNPIWLSTKNYVLGYRARFQCEQMMDKDGKPIKARIPIITEIEIKDERTGTTIREKTVVSIEHDGKRCDNKAMVVHHLNKYCDWGDYDNYHQLIALCNYHHYDFYHACIRCKEPGSLVSDSIKSGKEVCEDCEKVAVEAESIQLSKKK